MHQKNNFKIKNNIQGLFGLIIFIAVLIIGLVFFSYLIIIGAIIGLALFAAAYFRAKFFIKPKKKTRSSHGRTIEHDKERGSKPH